MALSTLRSSGYFKGKEFQAFIKEAGRGNKEVLNLNCLAGFAYLILLRISRNKEVKCGAQSWFGIWGLADWIYCVSVVMEECLPKFQFANC